MKFLLPVLFFIFVGHNVHASGICLIKKQSNNNIWYVEQDGSALTNNYYSIQPAIDKLAQLRQSGICPAHTPASVSCSIKKVENNSQWYVDLNNEHITSAYYSMDSAIAQMRSLISSNVCSAYVTAGCEIRKTPNNDSWKIFQAGVAISEGYYNFSTAQTQLRSLKQNSVCRQISDALCVLKKRENNDLWFVEQNGVQLSQSTTNLNAGVTVFQNLIADNVCQLSFFAGCELRKRDGNNLWYIAVGGEQLTSSYTNLDSAVTEMQLLRQNHVCQEYLRQPCKVTKADNDNSWRVMVGGVNILGSSYTNLQSAVTQFTSLVGKKICEDPRYLSTCMIKKDSGQNVWHVEQDGKRLSSAYYSISQATTLLNDLQTSQVCNKNLQQGCQVVKRQGENAWYVIQDGQQLSNLYYSLDSATAQFRSLYDTGVCKRGECEVRQERHGGIAVIRSGYKLNLSGGLDSAVSQLEELLSSNTCDLPQNIKQCNIRHHNGIYVMMDDSRPIGTAENYSELVAMRSRLQNLGYCSTLNPNEIVGNGNYPGGQDYDGPRSNDLVMEYIDDTIIAPAPPIVAPH